MSDKDCLMVCSVDGVVIWEIDEDKLAPKWLTPKKEL